MTPDASITPTPTVTPTITPSTSPPVAGCCDDLDHTIMTFGDLVDRPAVNTVKVFQFEQNGRFCFDELNVTGAPSTFIFKTVDDSIQGMITCGGVFINTNIRYSSASGKCYTGDISKPTSDGWIILTEV